MGIPLAAMFCEQSTLASLVLGGVLTICSERAGGFHSFLSIEQCLQSLCVCSNAIELASLHLFKVFLGSAI